MSFAVLRLIGFILGTFLITLAVSMAIPMLTLVIYERKEDMSAFLWARTERHPGFGGTRVHWLFTHYLGAAR